MNREVPDARSVGHPPQLCYDADFTPYGQEMDHSEHLQTSVCPPNYRFTGYEYDSETGLYYAFARYYSPRLGRFLSTDPLGGAVGDLQSNNAYSYVENNAPNFVDPSGMYLKGPSGTPGNGNDPTANPFNPAGNGSVWSAAMNGEIFGVPSGYYLNGMLSLNGVPVILPDTVWVTEGFDGDAPWSVSIDTQFFGFVGLGSVPTGGAGGGGMAFIGPDRHPTRSRVQCAEQYADRNSIANHLVRGGNAGDSLPGDGGPEPNFLENLFFGNVASGLSHLYMFAAGAEDPSLSDAGTVLLSGGQGVPGSSAGAKGAVGVVQDALMEQIGGRAAVDIGTGVGEAKLVYDVLSFLNGLRECK